MTMQVLIKDVIEKIIDYRGKTPKKLGSDWAEGGIPAISAKNIKQGLITREDTIRYVDAATYEKWMKEKVQAGDVLLTSEAPLGETLFLKDSSPLVLGQRLFALRTNPERLDPRYFYLYTRTPNFKKTLASYGTGATVSGIRQQLLWQVPLEIPDIDQQRKVADVASRYDNLIENNLKRISILKSMSLALYREWFIYYRFPGYQNIKRVESSLGEIPENWSVGRLDDLMVLQRGFDLPKASRANGKVPIYAASGITGFHNVAKVKGPGVVTGRSGTIGEVLYIQEDFWPLNTALWVKEFPKSKPLYAYYVLSELNLGQFNSGAAVPTLNRNSIHGIEVAIPPLPLQQEFQKIAGNMHLHIRILESQVKNLRQTRDLMLPRLMSGEVRV